MNAVARGLRLRRDNGHFFPDQFVDERRFARVGPPHDGDKPRFEL